MSLRRLLNVVYAAISEGKTEREQAEWDKWLLSDAAPGEKRRQRSRGTGDLMAVFGMAPPQRPRRAEA